MNFSMNPFGKKRRKDRSNQTATEVEKEYDDKIDRYLRHKHAETDSDESPLDNLFEWADNLLRHYHDQRERRGMAEGEIKKLRNRLGDASDQIDGLKDTVRGNREIYETKELEFAKELSMLQDKLDSIDESHRQNVRDITDRHKDTINDMERKHKEAVQRLQSQLLVNRDNNTQWPDDKLKLKFLDLHRLVESATNTGATVKLQEGAEVPTKLDPYGVTKKAGPRAFRYLLTCNIWTTLLTRFFSSLFGFGVLGPDGEGQKLLGDAYNGFLRLTYGDTDTLITTRGPAEHNFTPFYSDKLPNEWRTATFRIIAQITQESGGHTVSAANLNELNRSNMNLAVREIMEMLNLASSISNLVVADATEKSIRNLAIAAHDFALQFGIHSAQLRLVVPKTGDTVAIGPEYHDWEDEALCKGEKFTVLQVLRPGLQRVGNGRDDLETTRTIVPCEIVPSA